MLSGHTVILLTLTTLVMGFCIFFLCKYAKKSKLLFWAVCLVLAGGLGNMYDRIFREGNVVDFLHFEFWPDFPIFNVADCGVVIGAGLLILYFIIDTIKEYKLLGEQVVHYNLPAKQQEQLEEYLQVKHYPTYILIDRKGNIVDRNPPRPKSQEKLVDYLNDWLEK